jgi:predicted dehydrogenase
MSQPIPRPAPPARRDFLKAAGAAGFALGLPAVVRGADAPPGANPAKVRLGLIGCGGRGRWIADLFHQSGLAITVAIHDYFRDRVTEVGEKLNVPAERRFVGLDGYRRILSLPEVDAVAIETPPYFHPEQASAAVDAGKHVYLAKPVAVDVAGALAVIDAGQRAAAKNLSFLVDFQTRADEFFIGAAQAVHNGMIGAPVIGQAFYYASRLHPQADPKNPSAMARLRNWVFDIALSGDIIVEQNIHVIDVANWFLNAHPTKAVGAGGRKARTDVGDCWDHFAVTYTYPNGAIVDFSSAQFTTGFDDLCVRLCGATGTAEAHYGGTVVVRAKQGGYKGGKTAQIYQSGAAANIQNLCTSILNKNPVNNAQAAAESTLTAILGRTAAYTGAAVTWDHMIASRQRLDPKLELPATGVDWKP